LLQPFTARRTDPRQQAVATTVLACCDVHDGLYEAAEGRIREALSWVDRSGARARVQNFRVVLAAALARMGRRREQHDVLDVVEREVQSMNVVALEGIYRAMLPVALEGAEDHPLGVRFNVRASGVARLMQ
ncbi:MAG TPA: hypothetical protein VFZ93_04485, partial [Albitalea sp.]